MNKNLLGAFVLAGTLLVGGVANAANWNGLTTQRFQIVQMVLKHTSLIKHPNSVVLIVAVTTYSVSM